MQLLSFLKRSAPVAPVATPAKRDLAVKLRGRGGNMLGEAAEVDNTTASWMTYPLVPDALLDKLRTLVARSRQLALSSDYVKAFLRHCRQNIVGENGIMLQALSQDNGTLDDQANAAIEAEYRRQRAELLTGLQFWLRDVWLQTLGNSELLAFPALKQPTETLASRINTPAASGNLRILERLQRQLNSNVQEALALEVGLLQLKL